MGDRGTGKSTTIRAIADLLPEIVVDFPVPRSPMIITPPILESIRFNNSANFIYRWPTIDVNGKAGRASRLVLSLILLRQNIIR